MVSNRNPGDAFAALLDVPQQLAELRAEIVALRAAVEQSRRMVPAVEAARELGISERTVRRWIADGKIAVVRMGRTLRVDLESVRAQTTGEVARGARLRSVGGAK